MKIATVVGARPQFIKAAVVSRALEGRCDESIIHTGQHYDPEMSERFFEELRIPAPAINLSIGSGPHGAQTGRMLEGLERVLQELEPDWTLVYGDTNSTLAGALASVKLGIPVAHVEAGLRSYNRKMPEEINRALTDHASSLLFAPTENAQRTLLKEGLPDDRIRLVGDVMYDAALDAADRAGDEPLRKYELIAGEYIVATIHRAENTDDPDRLSAIFQGMARAELPVLCPLHPRTKSALGSFEAPNLRLINPVGYFEMASLVRHARLVVTDSGGLQKEAYFHRTPCLTLRSETEWVELVEMGWNRVHDPISPELAAEAIRDAINADLPKDAPNPYGDGQAGRKIAEILTTMEPRL